MGFLDDVVGKVVQAAGGGEQSGLANAVLGLLSSPQGEGGGLQGLLQGFADKGLGELASSWVGTGQNLPVSAEQLSSGLGPELIGQLASKAGISQEEATAKLTELLPSIVDRLTPDGKVPEGGLLQQGLAFLRDSLPKG